MDFKNLQHETSTRVIGLIVTTFFLAWSLVVTWSWSLRFFFAIIFGLQLAYFFKFVRMKLDDQSPAAPVHHTKPPENNGNGVTKEEEYQYLKNIVQHAGTGLLTFNAQGEVQILNTAAKKLLNLDSLSQITGLREVSPQLLDSIMRLKTGGRDLVRIEVNGNIIELAVYAIQLNLRNEIYKLISLQNIQSELEEKEMEAWHNLVRVLTHEIMNSVTPISSLANTVSDELREKQKALKGTEAEDMDDMVLALGTIQRRSEGLIRFVKDFRSLTRIPTPELTNIHVALMLEEICMLYKKELKNIKVEVELEPKELVIRADKDQIEQVLINLIQNSIQALEDQAEALIILKGGRDKDGRPFLSVSDNGPGIESEALEKIFIPFFTTKKRGSGIGLSLSRQIMRQHQGTLSVKTIEDQGTEFILRF
jgi:nitrogen fixation/metabolism regulation signal transduction histidine kinase